MNVLLCGGTGCVSSGSFNLKLDMEREIERKGLKEEVQVIATGCQGFCAEGPIVIVQPDGVLYCKVTPKDVPILVEEHFLKGRPLQKLLYTPPDETAPVPTLNTIPFFAKQKIVVLRNRGLIDPERIEDYIAADGYMALAKALTEMTPEDVISEIKASALRGRGGGGFPAGIKWETCRHAAKKQNAERMEQLTKEAGGDRFTKPLTQRPIEPVVICNADEGDPGAFMDRSIIECDPHAVIEGMTIAAYAVGARRGFVYVRQEYPLARKRLEKALEQARALGLLGENILGTKVEFDIKIVQGAGAFVCGESTALMASLEGKVGEPRAKYIHTVEYGYKDGPSLLNNVETLANIPLIILRGASWFTSMGTGDVSENPWGGSTGTKVFSLSGTVNNTGLIEVPMGITLREIIYDIGGGIPRGRDFKAVQTGGPSGGFLPAQFLDRSVDFDSLNDAGTMMGSGGMVILDEGTCLVDSARFFVKFLADESCGKCVPCREGLRRSTEILDRIVEGKGRDGDVEILEEMGEVMQDCCLCALGTSAPNPVLTTIRYFRDEYECHIQDHKCPGGVCKDLISYYINPDRCDGCHACVRACPTNGILGEVKQAHSIIESKCIKCGACVEVCKRDAVMHA